MKQSQKRQIERLRKVVGFGSRHEPEFGPISKAHELFGQTVDLLNELDEILDPTRGQFFGSHMSPRQQALKELREDMEHIADTARVIERHNPFVEGKFVLPDKRKSQELATAARKFAEDAQLFVEEFISYEMPNDFIDQLRTKLEVYLKLTGQLGDADDEKKPDERISDALKRGEVLIQVLDVIVHNKFKGSKRTLAEWTLVLK